MPGPISDSYDPEFGTSSNVALVDEAIGLVRDRVTKWIGSDELQNIIGVSEAAISEPPPGSRPRRIVKRCHFTESELRVIRFCLDRARSSL